jgi:predicted alpha/beta-fold hydrolase
MNPASEFPAFRPFPGLGNDALSRSAVERVFAGAGRNRVTGDYGSPYVVGTAAKAHRHGFHVIRLNARNCGGTEELAADSYHGGVTTDLRCVLEHLIGAMAMTRVVLVGFSFGGNMVLKLAGELGAGGPEELVGIATLERPEIRVSAALAVVATERGGHVAFLGRAPARNGSFADRDRRWGENRMVQFCLQRVRERGTGRETC